MGEIQGHSKGIWRSIIVKRTKDSDYVPDEIINWLNSRHIRWSFQRYAVTNDEPAHISYRIEFPDLTTITCFREFLKKHRDILDETSWDEKPETKRAYEFGTKMFLLMMGDMEFSRYLTNSNCLLQAFHGFFNNSHRDYREEAEIYIEFLSALCPHIKNGLSIHNIGDEEE